MVQTHPTSPVTASPTASRCSLDRMPDDVAAPLSSQVQGQRECRYSMKLGVLTHTLVSSTALKRRDSPGGCFSERVFILCLPAPSNNSPENLVDPAHAAHENKTCVATLSSVLSLPLFLRLPQPLMSMLLSDCHTLPFHFSLFPFAPHSYMHTSHYYNTPAPAHPLSNPPSHPPLRPPAPVISSCQTCLPACPSASASTTRGVH